MQNKNEFICEFKKYFSFEKIRIVAIFGLFGCIAGGALAMYYVKFTTPVFHGSGIYKMSMVSLGSKDYFPVEEANNLILFTERKIKLNADCEPFKNNPAHKQYIHASSFDKKSSVIRVDSQGEDFNKLTFCLEIFFNELSIYDQKARSIFRELEITSNPHKSGFTPENPQVKTFEGGKIGSIDVSKIPIKLYPINLFKLIFLFTLGGIFIGILICYCKVIFFEPS